MSSAHCDLILFALVDVRFNKEILQSKKQDDLRIHKSLYKRLKDLRDALPSHLRDEWRSTLGTTLLW